jgi:hypothetical protein
MGRKGAVAIAGQSLNSGLIFALRTYSVWCLAQLYRPGAVRAKSVAPTVMEPKHAPVWRFEREYVFLSM